MKRLVLVFGIALALCTTAMAADIAFYVGAPNTDGWYDVATMTADVETIIAETGHLFGDVQQFNDDQYDEFGAWVDANTDDGELDIIWLNGCMPSVLYPFPNLEPDGSRAEEWLDGGNMIINVGDWFGYVSYAGGSRQTENGGTGAANILDLSSGIIVSADNTSLTVTPTGKDYLPSLGDTTVITYRPIALTAVAAPWEVAAIFASTNGSDDPGTAGQADPVVLHNTETDGYIAFVNQSAGSGPPGWLEDRGLTCAEFIGNWVAEVIGLGPNPFAGAPNPKNGSMIEQTQVVLQWKAGSLAVQHDVYFGDSAEAVEAATRDDADIFVGTLATTMLPVGGDEPLVPGQTYYWRVDEINDAEPNSPWTGSVWSFTIRPQTAWGPLPIDGMRNVDPDQDLTWEGGMGVLFHTVYFGTSIEEVDTAPFGFMTAQPTYDPGTLELDTTYYWRVDEFAFPANATFKGDIWSFTTRGEGGGVKAEYFGGMELAGDPILSQIEPQIDHQWGSAEVAGGLADLVSARWRGNLEVPLTETYRLITTSDDGVRLWLDGRLVIDNWTDHGTTDNTATVDLVAGQYYMIQMEYYENGGGAVAQLSWQSDTLPRGIITQGWLQLPLRATSPSPAHLDPHANQAGLLTWIGGDDATGHDVYFGDDADAVANADTTTAGTYRGRQAAGATSFNPGPLEWGKTYYWRVDEVNPDGVLTGALWSFTAADFLVVEDFERFDDDIDGGTAIFQTWIDGVDNGTGSYVGYEVAVNMTFGETTIVYGGYQSMPLEYDNSVAPFYSETSRTSAPAINLTVNGMDTLTFFVRGQRANELAPLYVGLQSGATRVNVLVPDAAITQATSWQEVNIPLADFAPVNPAAVNEMFISLGNPDAPAPGGAGQIFIDEIRATKAP